MRTMIGLMMVLTALAGCADGEAVEPVPEEAFQDIQTQATDDTGVIRGVVVDAIIVPIADATITNVQTGDVTTTNENGVFFFEGLEPGAYFLKAEKIGYESIQSSATVVAGVDDPPILRIQMVEAPGTLPFISAETYDGFLECSFRVGTGNNAGSVGFNACSAGGGVGSQKAEFPHSPFDPVVEPSFFQTELLWKSSQTTGDELSLVVGPESCADVKYARADGPSPQVYKLDAEKLAAEGVGPENTICTRVFTYTSGSAAHLWGMQVQQKFTFYSHGFYNMLPIEDWQFSVDGEHPLPS